MRAFSRVLSVAVVAALVVSGAATASASGAPHLAYFGSGLDVAAATGFQGVNTTAPGAADNNIRLQNALGNTVAKCVGSTLNGTVEKTNTSVTDTLHIASGTFTSCTIGLVATTVTADFTTPWEAVLDPSGTSSPFPGSAANVKVTFSQGVPKCVYTGTLSSNLTVVNGTGTAGTGSPAGSTSQTQIHMAQAGTLSGALGGGACPVPYPASAKITGDYRLSSLNGSAATIGGNDIKVVG